MRETLLVGAQAPLANAFGGSWRDPRISYFYYTYYFRLRTSATVPAYLNKVLITAESPCWFVMGPYGDSPVDSSTPGWWLDRNRAGDPTASIHGNVITTWLVGSPSVMPQVWVDKSQTVEIGMKIQPANGFIVQPASRVHWSCIFYWFE